MKRVLLQMKPKGRLTLLPRQHHSQARVLLLLTAWKEMPRYSPSPQDIPAPLQDPKGLLRWKLSASCSKKSLFPKVQKLRELTSILQDRPSQQLLLL